MAERYTNKELEKILDDYTTRLKDQIKLDKIVLFGSYAKGLAHNYSDIDLLVVSDALPEMKPKGANGLYLDKLVGLNNVNIKLEVIGAHPNKLIHPVTKSFFDEVFSTGKEFNLETKTLVPLSDSKKNEFSTSPSKIV